MTRSLSKLLIFGLIYGTVSGDDQHESWPFEATTDGSYQEKDISVSEKKRTVFNLRSTCTPLPDQDNFVQVKLYHATTLETIIYEDMNCTKTEVAPMVKYSNPMMFSDGDDPGQYKLQVYGKPSISFKAVLELDTTDIPLKNSINGSVTAVVEYGSLLVKSFEVTAQQIKTTSDYSYIQVAAFSKDKYLDPLKRGIEGKRLVAKLMVTQDPRKLEEFYAKPDSIIPGSMRLSFSTYGMITISGASKPVLKAGTWLVGVVIDPLVVDAEEARKKEVTLTITIRTDYEYAQKIWILFGVSLLGLIIPLLARMIFDYQNVRFKNIKFKFWLLTIKHWFWSGKKGLTYLTALLASLLIVSAFQVVHAKYADMKKTGNRDTCFYNEKCFRPYGDYYDVSVNGIASNLPFMVHGVILVLYFSIAETYCRSNEHKHFDYSIPYSFGLSFICEGFGSLLYHICPSQIIFQFDTLFMFVITIIMIIAIFEGNSIRDCDLKYSTIARHKAIRTPKVFAFFVGPIYFFNFIGNLIATEDESPGSWVTIFNYKVKWHGLPVAFIAMFYVVFGLWWVFILAWAAYKLGLLPTSLDPQNVLVPDEVQGVAIQTDEHMTRLQGYVMTHGWGIKATMFTVYCVGVVAGFVMSLLGKIPFSIFILGILVVAQIALTAVFFVPVGWTVLQYFYNLPVQLTNNTCSVSKHFFILLGIVMYVLIGCVVTAISLVFFTVFSVTDKSVYPWRSREINSPCYLGDFYDTHDFWHLFASFALMMMVMVIVQISKPCRECYVEYLKKNKERIETVRRKTMLCHKSRSRSNGQHSSNVESTQREDSSVGVRNPNYKVVTIQDPSLQDANAVSSQA